MRRTGGWVWLAGSLRCRAHSARATAPDTWRLARAAAVAFGVLIFVYCDSSLLLYHLGQELAVRSTRYRTHLVLVLCVLAAGFLVRQLPPWFRTLAPNVVACGGAVLAVAVIALQLAINWPQQSVLSPGDIVARVAEMVGRDDYARLRAHDRSAGTALEYLNAFARGRDRVLHDYPTLIKWIDHPQRNPWLNPGVFPLLDAANPVAAAHAARLLSVRWNLVRRAHHGTELYSSTGLRHLAAADVAALVVDERTLQLFELDPAPVAVRDVTPELHPHFVRVLSGAGQTRGRLVPLFAAPVTTSGDYELRLDFQAPQALDVWVRGGSLGARRFRLRSAHPYTAGPQRLRFVVRSGERIQFVLDGATLRLARVDDIRLMRREEVPRT